MKKKGQNHYKVNKGKVDLRLEMKSSNLLNIIIMKEKPTIESHQYIQTLGRGYQLPDNIKNVGSHIKH